MSPLEPDDDGSEYCPDLITDEMEGKPLGNFMRSEIERFYHQINNQAKGDYLAEVTSANIDELTDELTGLLAMYALGRTRLDGIEPTLDQFVSSLEVGFDKAAEKHGVSRATIYTKRTKAANLIASELDRAVGGIEGTPKASVTSIRAVKQPSSSVSRQSSSKPEDRYVGADHIKMYKQEAGALPLLKAAEEVELAKAIEAGLYAEKILSGEITSEQVFNDGELEWLAEEGLRASHVFIERNLKLAMNLAGRRTRAITPGMQYEDLVEEANFGLFRAVEKFDFTKGYKFSTYATWWIRQQLDRSIANLNRSVRLPVHRIELIKKVRRFRDDFERDNGFPASDDDVVAEFKDLKTIFDLMELDDDARSIISLDKPVGDDDGETIGSMFDQYSESTESIALRLLAAEELREAVSSLPPELAEVIEMRYGLDGQGEKTLVDIADILNTSRETVRKRESKGLRLLFGQLTDGNQESVDQSSLPRKTTLGIREKEKIKLGNQLSQYDALLSDKDREVIKAYIKSKSVGAASQLVDDMDEKNFSRRLKYARGILDDAANTASA